jgi:fumarate reductase flavoprotein subunit
MKKTAIMLPLIVMVLILFGCAESAPAVRTAEPVAAANPEPAPAVVGPGPYTGNTMGFHGRVSVTLEVADGILTSVIVRGSDETVGIGSLAIDSMGDAMLAANSIEVDIVSGATHTSRAVMDAAAKALAQAGLTNADLIRN